MKKNVLLIGLLLIFTSVGFAQTRTYFNFEDVLIEGVFGWTGATWDGVVANPSKTGINTSENVGLTKSGTAKFSGVAYYADTTINLIGAQVFTIDVYSAEAGFIKLKLEKKGDNSVNVVSEQEYSTPGVWQNLTFDYGTSGTNDTYSKIVFIVDSKNAIEGKEWYLDNLKGPELMPVATAINDVRESALQVSSYPNPFSNTVNIEFYLHEQSNVSLSIFDLSGQELFILSNDNLGVGKQRMVWNGTNSSGSVVANGIYFVKLKINEEIVTRKIMKN